MSKLPIATSLFLASLVYASSTSAHPTSIATVAASPQQSSASSTPGSSSTSTPTTAQKKKSSKKHHGSKREPTQKTPTPQRITEIQSALGRGGYYQGTPTGKWDSSTVAAMQKFQSENGLTSSGKIDATSLQKLGLGSGTAGVDAPKPAPPPRSAANTSAVAPPATPATSASSLTPPPPSAPKR